jgi:hypothetical protein
MGWYIVRRFGGSAVRRFGCSVVRLCGDSAVRQFGESAARRLEGCAVWLFGGSALLFFCCVFFCGWVGIAKSMKTTKSPSLLLDFRSLRNDFSVVLGKFDAD